MKVEIFHSQLQTHITNQLLTTMSVGIRIYLPLKELVTLACILSEYPFLVNKSSFLLIEVNNCIINMGQLPINEGK